MAIGDWEILDLRFVDSTKGWGKDRGIGLGIGVFWMRMRG